MDETKDEKMEMAAQIAKLITDGQKEVMARLDGIEGRFDGLSSDVGTIKQDVGTLKQDVGTLKQDVSWLKVELKRIDKKYDVTAQAQYDLLQDVRKDVGDVRTKLEEHMRQPAHA
jgi:archaellum component FlaC